LETVKQQSDFTMTTMARMTWIVTMKLMMTVMATSAADMAYPRPRLLQVIRNLKGQYSSMVFLALNIFLNTVEQCFINPIILMLQA
jgi:hypothetical protein